MTESEELEAELAEKNRQLRGVRIAIALVLVIGAIFVLGILGVLHAVAHSAGLQHYLNRYACLQFWGDEMGAAVCP